MFDGSDADAFTYTNTSDSSGISRHYFNTKVLDRIVKSNSTSIAYSDSATPTSNSFDHRTTICYYIGTPTNQVSLNIAATECDPTVESFNSYLQNHPVHLVYKLATPVLAATFDPVTLQAFLDHNNFWSDANDITEVSYEVAESKDIQAARKQFEAEENGHHKLVRWNQWAKPLNADYWGAYNTDYTSVSFEDGVATQTWLDAKVSYMATVRSKYAESPLQTEGDVWYASYMINPSKDNLTWGIEMCGGRQLTDGVKPANVWSHTSYITTVKNTNRNAIYISNLKNTTTAVDIGMTAKTKAPYYINLTQMFGAGNEPSKAEFERICALNGIDLTTYQPYDTGSDRWLIIP